MNHPLYISASEILSVPIKECQERLVDIRLGAIIAWRQRAPFPDSENCYTLVREGVFRSLIRAQSFLPGWCRLRLYEGLRPLHVQQRLFREEMGRVSARKPGICFGKAYQEASKLVAPVWTPDGSPAVPPHATGGAVDVDLVDAYGQCLDFGMDIDEWTTAGVELCRTECPGVSPVVARSRGLLREAMSRAGFVNYDHEWWHYSIGDRYWAFRSGHSCAYYGACLAAGEAMPI